ncbi:MAG TPA: acyloxyacyl hydrolase [Verrucomicrobiae bacterium]
MSLLHLSKLEAGLPPLADNFQSGRFEASLGTGFFISPFINTAQRPTVDYMMTELQLGYMLTDVRGPGMLRGNLECAAAVFGDDIFRGRGNYISGTTFWLRYNFVPAAGRFVPYAQLGGGVTETDLDRRIEGRNFNFNLGLGVGVRCLLAPNWSANLEYRYQHISNAGTSYPNVGINADGPVISLSYFF